MYIPVSSSPFSLFCPLSMLHMSMAAFKYWGQCSVLHYILAPSGWIFSSSSGCFHSPSWSWALYSEHTLPVFQLECSSQECSSQTIMWHFRPGCGCAQPRLREAIILFALDMLLHIESKLLSAFLGNYITSLTHTEWVIKWMPRIFHVCFFQISPNTLFFLIGGWDSTFIPIFFFISPDLALCCSQYRSFWVLILASIVWVIHAICRFDFKDAIDS